MRRRLFYNPSWMPTEEDVEIWCCPVPEHVIIESYDQYEPYLIEHYKTLAYRAFFEYKNDIYKWYHHHIDENVWYQDESTLIDCLIASDKFSYQLEWFKGRINAADKINCSDANATVYSIYENMNLQRLFYLLDELYMSDTFSNYQDDDDDFEEDDDPDDIINQSRYYTQTAAKDFFTTLIKNFDKYGLQPQELVVLSKMLMITEEPKAYEMKGYLLLTVKEVESEGNFKFQEVQLDYDGLQLTTGGYVTEDEMIGGDSYNDVIYPIDDEGEAMNTIQVIDSFFDEFFEKLQSEDREVEFSDSGDEIIKL